MEQLERFAILLDQIDLPTELREQYFSGSTIEKLVVDKPNNQWDFHLKIPAILPVEIYQVIDEKLKSTFAHIAKASMTLQATNQTFTEELVQAYWPLSVAKIPAIPPIFPNMASWNPEANGLKISLPVRNEQEVKAFASKCSSTLSNIYTTFGFPPLQFTGVASEDEATIQKYREQKEQEDRTRMLQAVEEMAQRENGQKEQGEALSGPVTIGYKINDEDLVSMSSIVDEERRKTIQGYVFDVETRELRSGRVLLTFKMTDYTDSFIVKMFSRDKEDIPLFGSIKKGMWLKARGSIQNDTFIRDLVMIANDINEVKPVERMDTALEGEKRVELHLHTNMSAMDGMNDAGDFIARAKKWGHEAIAITDHGGAQSFPDAYHAGKKHDIKILYGVEANLVDDGANITFSADERSLTEETYVVFDVETTGLSAAYDTIIELAAVKVQGNEIIERFERFANPHKPLSAKTIELTGITDDMVANAPEVETVLREYVEWIGDHTLVAHNAPFDMGFLQVGLKKYGMEKVTNPVIDTLELARNLYPELRAHGLKPLCKKFDIELTQHHRAIYDTEATAYLLIKMLKDVGEEKEVTKLSQLNELGRDGIAYKRARSSHMTLLAQNEVGLKNLFKLISYSHTNYYSDVPLIAEPRIPRSLLETYREGILVGTACEEGEVFKAMMQKTKEEALELAAFYDYIEVQPPENVSYLVETEQLSNEQQIKEIVQNLIKLGKELNKPVVATGNAHYLDPVGKAYRKILVSSVKAPTNQARRRKQLQDQDVHFRTTDEMLASFAFLGEEKAKEIVVTNTQKIANMIEKVEPIRKDLYTPKIEGADEEIRQMSYDKAREIYGEVLPAIVEERVEKELKSIIGHGFAVIYLISHQLVKKSLEDGYLVGSRGSVGSSLVATFTDITEINPLPPHYVCPSCKHSEFFNDGSVGSGFDLPDKDCPKCGTTYTRDGHDIPFETFLGFKGDKVPDIDLNFSGDYQATAHDYTKVLFGEDYVFRAGTIGTVAERTAYGFVKNYASEREMHIRSAEVDRLVAGCTGVKRTTGQHPGGIIVIPDYMDVYDFTPIQYPADELTAEWKTTHFDFHSIHDNVLKLDILGHDDPTVLRMLQDLSGIDPKTIPTNDPEVMKIFSSTESLGVTEEQIGAKTGTFGIPECGTRFVRQMLEDTKPSTFSELIQISGLSHGTDVWLGNAQDLIQAGTSTLSEVIGCRDDIMVYLIYQGLEPATAFQIMESVRKGKGVKPEWEEEMKQHNVPDWYIESCKKIKYMFPKAHAAAYMLMAIRVAYFKVHHPILYYAAYFSVRADDFDLAIMIQGSTALRAKIAELNALGMEATAKDKNLLVVLELCLEMCERGFSFKPIDLYRSDAKNFVIDEDEKSLIPPFRAISGLGESVAEAIVAARKEGEFLSKEDLKQRGKVSNTLIQTLENLGCLEGMPDENQLSLF